MIRTLTLLLLAATLLVSCEKRDSHNDDMNRGGYLTDVASAQAGIVGKWSAPTTSVPPAIFNVDSTFCQYESGAAGYRCYEYRVVEREKEYILYAFRRGSDGITITYSRRYLIIALTDTEMQLLSSIIGSPSEENEVFTHFHRLRRVTD